jgi:hypothetical protein
MTYTGDQARISLSPDEAVVLFDLLSRWTDEKDAPTPSSDCFESPAECAVLHNVLASLETQLAAPFRAEYADLVERARARLAQEWQGATLRA